MMYLAQEVPLFSVEGFMVILFDLAFLICAGLLGYMLFRYLFGTKSRETLIKLDNDTFYRAHIGNNLPRYDAGDTFRGIDIELPKAFPHMVLDSHHNDKFFGHASRYFLQTSQRIELEGNFNKDFQAYIPKGYQVLALSILTPDVLETLQHSSLRYDVELFDFRLRLISPRNAYGKPAREADIIHAATMVLKEIDHKLRSWSSTDSKTALTKHLAVEANPTVKFGRFTLRLSSFLYGTIFFVLGGLFWALAWYFWNDPESKDGTWLIAGLAFALFPCAFVLFVFGYSKSWLQWFFRLLRQ